MSEQDPRNPDELDVEAPEADAAEQREPAADVEPEPEGGDLPDEVDPGDLAEQQREAIPPGADEDDYR